MHFNFDIKSHPSFVHYSRNLFNVILYCRNLPEEIRYILYDKIINSAYFAHNENILFSTKYVN